MARNYRKILEEQLKGKPAYDELGRKYDPIMPEWGWQDLTTQAGIQRSNEIMNQSPARNVMPDRGGGYRQTSMQASSNWTPDKLMQLVQMVFPKEQWENAFKIIGGESSWNPFALNQNKNGTTDHGLFQINDIHAPWIMEQYGWTMQDVEQDPVKNVIIAKEVYDRSRGWSPWASAKSVGVPLNSYTKSKTPTYEEIIIKQELSSGSIMNPQNVTPEQLKQREIASDKAYEEQKNREAMNTPANWPGWKEAKERGGFDLPDNNPPNIFEGIRRLFSSITPTAYAAEKTQLPQPTTKGKGYTVKKGDTLWDISEKYLGSGFRWRELLGYTGDPRKMPIGTQITIPQPAPRYTPPPPQQSIARQPNTLGGYQVPASASIPAPRPTPISKYFEPNTLGGFQLPKNAQTLPPRSSGFTPLINIPYNQGYGPSAPAPVRTPIPTLSYIAKGVNPIAALFQPGTLGGYKI